jgi:hypothetical protein
VTTYTGDRTIDGIVALADGEPLDPRYDIEVYSDQGFEWTYEGGESRQLALAILAHHLGDDEAARQLSEGFMREVIANLDNTWEMSSEDVQAMVDEIRGNGSVPGQSGS